MARVRPTVVVGGFGVVDAWALAYVHDAVTRAVVAPTVSWPGVPPAAGTSTPT